MIDIALYLICLGLAVCVLLTNSRINDLKKEIKHLEEKLDKKQKG